MAPAPLWSTLARVGHALSDPTRAQILLALSATEATPSELVAAIGCSKQSMSNHLACLRGCQLVVARQCGRHMHYRLANEALRHAIVDLCELGAVLGNGCQCSGPCDCDGAA